MMGYLVLNGPHYSTTAQTSAWQASEVGLKAVGLAALPVHWTPPFLAVTTSAFFRWKEGSQAKQPASILTSAAFTPLLTSQPERLIIRSSAPVEHLQSRGWLETKTCEATMEGILEAVESVWSYAAKTVALTDSGVGVVVQQQIAPKLYGHLSNERRVSRNSSRWLCEVETPTVGIGSKLVKFRATKESPCGGHPLLNCHNQEELQTRLKEVATWSMTDTRRCHYEWVWDGARLWIVQRDVELPIVGPAPKTTSLAHLFGLQPPKLSVFVKATDAVGDWKKTESLRVFARAKMPTPSLYVLEDKKTLGEILSGKIGHRLRADLKSLLESPIVFRSDVLTTEGTIAFLSPRSATIQDLDGAFAWLCDTAGVISSKGFRPGQFCFIAHRFIPARAAALSLSRPDNPRVRIDGIWGFPDGLFWFPHDSFEVITSGKPSIEHHVRCKPYFLTENESGAWIQNRCPAPWDWKPSLVDSELLARISHQ